MQESRRDYQPTSHDEQAQIDRTQHTPGPLKAETFAAFTGHGVEYGVTFYDADLPEGEAGDSYGDLITMVDERNDADPARIEQAQAETMRFASEIVRRWNAFPELLAALEAASASEEAHGPMCGRPLLHGIEEDDYDPYEGIDGTDACVCWMGDARAAIRKARGQ